MTRDHATYPSLFGHICRCHHRRSVQVLPLFMLLVSDRLAPVVGKTVTPLPRNLAVICVTKIRSALSSNSSFVSSWVIAAAKDFSFFHHALLCPQIQSLLTPKSIFGRAQTDLRSKVKARLRESRLLVPSRWPLGGGGQVHTTYNLSLISCL